jgi:hypothetical protein
VDDAALLRDYAPESVRARYGTVDAVIYDWWLNHATPIAAARVLSQVDDGPKVRFCGRLKNQSSSWASLGLTRGLMCLTPNVR